MQVPGEPLKTSQVDSLLWRVSVSLMGVTLLTGSGLGEVEIFKPPCFGFPLWKVLISLTGVSLLPGSGLGGVGDLKTSYLGFSLDRNAIRVFPSVNTCVLSFREDLSKNQPVNSSLRLLVHFWTTSVPKQPTLKLKSEVLAVPVPIAIW